MRPHGTEEVQEKWRVNQFNFVQIVTRILTVHYLYNEQLEKDFTKLPQPIKSLMDIDLAKLNEALEQQLKWRRKEIEESEALNNNPVIFSAIEAAYLQIADAHERERFANSNQTARFQALIQQLKETWRVFRNKIEQPLSNQENSEENEVLFDDTLYTTSPGSPGVQDDPDQINPGELSNDSFVIHKGKQTKAVVRKSSEPNKKTSNSFYNAIALTLTSLMVTQELFLQEQAQRLNISRKDFLSYFKEELGLTKHPVEHFNEKLEINDSEDEMVIELAAILHEYTLEYLKENYAEHQTAYENHLLSTFNAYLVDNDVIADEHPELHEHFKKLKHVLGEVLTTDEELIKLPEVHALKEAYQSQDPELLKSAWTAIHQKMNAPSPDNHQHFRLQQVYRKIKHEGLLEWWDNKGKDIYFSDSATSAPFAITIETNALASLLGINVIVRQNKHLTMLGSGYGVIPMSELTKLPVYLVNELVEHKIGRFKQSGFKINKFSSLADLEQRFAQIKPRLQQYISEIAQHSEPDQPLNDLLNHNTIVIGQLLKLGIIEKRDDNDVYFVKNKQQQIDYERITDIFKQQNRLIKSLVLAYYHQPLATIGLIKQAEQWHYIPSSQLQKKLLHLKEVEIQQELSYLLEKLHIKPSAIHFSDQNCVISFDQLNKMKMVELLAKHNLDFTVEGQHVVFSAEQLLSLPALKIYHSDKSHNHSDEFLLHHARGLEHSDEENGLLWHPSSAKGFNHHHPGLIETNHDQSMPLLSQANNKSDDDSESFYSGHSI